MQGRLHRSPVNKMIAGVCGGLAESLKVDPTIIRVIWAALALAGGFGLILYIICALVVPIESGYQLNFNNSFDFNDGSKVMGIVFIVIGAFFLITKFVRWFDMKILIAVAFIAFGLYVIIKGGSNKYE